MKKFLLFFFILTSTFFYSDDVDVNSYPARKLSYFSKIAYKSYKKDLKEIKNSEGPHFQVESTIFKGKSKVFYKNQIKTIDQNDLEVMQMWSNMHKLDWFIALYKRKILVKENTEYWIIMQEGPVSFIKNDSKIYLFYYYIGAYNGLPIYLSPGYMD